MYNCIRLAVMLGTLGATISNTASAAVIHVPADQPTIQAGIDAAVTGDLVLVAPGIYQEAINFKGKAITVRGSGGQTMTFIDAPFSHGCAVRCENDEGPGTVLDGFQIVGGSGCGGSMFVPSRGGGMLNDNASPTVTNCTFRNNTADLGAGMANVNSSSPTVTNCTFTENTGGGMYNSGSSSPTVTNCTFTENTGRDGGGMYNSGSSSPTVTNCTFSGNTAGLGLGLGGGMYNVNGSNPNLTNCTFSGNSARVAGGGMANRISSSPTVTNCTFSGNTAGDEGGGMYNVESSSPTVTNCTFTENTASFGGGMHNYFSSSPTLTNCILWSNSPDEVSNVSSTPTIAYSDVAGSGGSDAWNPLLGTDGGGNIDADPLFVDPLGLDGLAGTEDDDVRLLPNSPAINTGNDAAVPVDVTTDLDGLPRVVCGVDMGAYENQSPPPTIHNISTHMFFCTIQECVEEAEDFEECVVPPGTYFEAIDFLGKAITVRSSDGAAVTIIDATGVPAIGDTVTVVRCASGETADTMLDGFTITGGTGDTTVFSSPAGGGMFNNNTCPTVKNCRFIGNTALGTFSSGGGMFNNFANPKVINCTFSGNRASFAGGGMTNDQFSSPTVTNCTFSGNMANAGSAMLNNRSSNPRLTNCILWGDTPDVIFNNQSTPTIAFSDVAGSGGSAAWDASLGADGGGNIDVDPLFVNPNGLDGLVGTIDDNLRIMAHSRAINAGDNGAVPFYLTTDLDDLPRIVCQVDMGAYENQTALLLIHNTTTATFYCTIQQCIDAAADSQECVVAPGSYFEAIDFLGKAITVRSASGDPTDTIINGSGHFHVVQFVNGETASTVLVGFTITGGHANGATPNHRGGGIYCDASSPTITDCIISDNVAKFGGGMSNQGGSNPTINHCTFRNNSSTVNGGGIYNIGGSSPMITRCTFTANVTGADGGGIYNKGSSPTITDCIFSGNLVNSGGGILNFNGSSPAITNCIFSGNVANFNGGAMVNNVDCNPTLVNCTLSNNTANLGGGLFNDNSSPVSHNSIFWNNSDSGGMDESAQIHTISGTPIVNDSNFMGGWTGVGSNNINTDPLFVDADGADNTIGTPDDDLHLQAGSPCIDVGNNSVVPVAITTDLDGLARILCDRVDMGVYEFWGDFDCNQVVDLLDFANWDTCMTGPGGGPYESACAAFDFDGDLDIDIRDFAAFGIVFSP